MGRLRLAEQQNQPPPVTLPRVVLRTLEDDGREIAKAAAEKRVIRAGRECSNGTDLLQDIFSVD